MCGEKQEVLPTFPTQEKMIADKKYSCQGISEVKENLKFGARLKRKYNTSNTKFRW